jgi:hypothetical protein
MVNIMFGNHKSNILFYFDTRRFKIVLSFVYKEFVSQMNLKWGSHRINVLYFKYMTQVIACLSV